MSRCIVVLTVVCFLVLLSTPSFAASNLEQGVDELAQQIADVVRGQGKTTIAVVEFVDLNGSVNQFGKLLAEKLITRLFTHGAGALRIVERRQLMRVIAEQKLSISGLVDRDSIGKIASTLGVDALVTGSVSLFGDQVEINSRCISVESAMVFAAAATTVPATGVVKQMMATPGTYVDDSWPPGTSDPVGHPGGAKAHVGETYGSDGYSFVFERCVRVGSKVTCHFRVTNEKEDRILYTFANYGSAPVITRLFDNLGNEYTPTRAKLGTSEEESYTTKTMITGIGIPASFTFEGVTAEATSISVLQIGYEGPGSKKSSFKIRGLDFVQ